MLFMWTPDFPPLAPSMAASEVAVDILWVLTYFERSNSSPWSITQGSWYHEREMKYDIDMNDSYIGESIYRLITQLLMRVKSLKLM